MFKGRTSSYSERRSKRISVGTEAWLGLFDFCFVHGPVYRENTWQMIAANRAKSMFESTAELCSLAKKNYGVLQTVWMLTGFCYCVKIRFYYILISACLEKCSVFNIISGNIYIYIYMYVYRVAQKMYTLFTHQYLWNKFKWNFYLWGSLKDDVYRRKPATLDDMGESIAMSCAAITLDTLQNAVHAAVRRLPQCLDADGGHFEHRHWIQNSRTSLISILHLYKYSGYGCRVIFFMSKCEYIFGPLCIYIYIYIYIYI